MFGFLKRDKGGGDPLGSPKNVSQWIEDLPAGDIHAAQKAVVAKLVEFNHAEQEYSRERLAVLRALDEQTREMQASLCAQYLRNPRMFRVIEGRLWAVIQGFYYEVARGYHAFLMHLVANPGGRKLQSQVPLITARALRAMANVLKWRYFHFERIDEKLWLRMHNIYRMAEFDGFAGRELTLYDTELRRSSCRDTYLQALLLSPFGNGNLLPKQIEMVDCWLSNWAGLAQFDSQYDPTRHCFCIDTAKGQGLRRIRNPADNAAWRYLGAGPLRARISQARTLLNEGKAPASLGLGEDFRLPEGYALLDLFENELAPLEERERRRQPRKAEHASWEIVRDLTNIFTVLQTQSGSAPTRMRTTLTAEEILDMKLYGFVTERTRAAQARTVTRPIPADQRARWFQVDQSDEGIGFTVSGAGPNWAKSAHLLAMRPDGSQAAWQVGVVRRVVSSNDGQRVIGVQLLGGSIELIDLEQEALLPDPELAKDGYEVHDSAHGPGQLGHALLLTKSDGTRAIVMESTRYGHGRQYLTRLANGKTQLVQMESVQSKGEGWLKAAYTVLAAS